LGLILIVKLLINEGCSKKHFYPPKNGGQVNKKLLRLIGFLVPAFVKHFGGQAGTPLIGNAVTHN
jgi:hypothetical protein